MRGSGRKQTLKLPCLPQTPPPFQGQLLPLGIPGWPSRALSVGLKGSTFPCGSGVELPRSRGFCTAWADFLLRDGCSDPAQNNLSSFLALGLLLEARASGKEGKEGLLRPDIRGLGEPQLLPRDSCLLPEAVCPKGPISHH